ncbi:dihydrolipoamide acetyltransferase family protein [Streptococcus halichoeri]|uniref:dihydrolipoamide acetyltransferase family protein n=1 Tax=Streptococcus halichoeri TaxID=254785 RepID=UPI00135C9785|nr:dihydrolipoamide acetyltransferase family protein [Streptococcus halichoeri]
MYHYILPDAGEGTHESAIMSWSAQVGDQVKEDDILLEIESDKAVVALPCPVDGYLAKIYVEAGDIGIVGQPIADIAESKEELQAALKGGGSDATMAKSKATSTTLASDLDQTDVGQSALDSTQTKDQKDAQPTSDKDYRQLAVPRVRKYARAKGIDLTQVTGTGNHGHITIEDLDTYLAQALTHKQVASSEQDQQARSEDYDQATLEERQTPASTNPQAKGNQDLFVDTIEKIPAMRRTIADALAKSSNQVAQVTVFDQVEVEALVAHRQKMKVLAAERDIKLTFTPYLVKALVAMLKHFPELNVSLDMEKNELHRHQYYNIGVATDTPRGLMVAMIRNAQSKSLFEIANDISAIAQKARDGKLEATDMGKGSISVTNVGAAATSGVWSTPIINLPEVAILNVGRIDQLFLPDEEGNPILKPVMKLSFAFDHRVVDGVYAQQAINLLKNYLHDPDLLLAEG